MRVGIEKLREILSYNPETGILTWKPRDPASFSCVATERNRVATRWNALRAGKPAGHMNSRGYIVVCIEAKTFQHHRIAWALHYGEWPSDQIDHVNHDKTDNRIINLRDVSGYENCRNRSLPENTSSGEIGVHFHKPSQKWHARIYVDGVRQHIGAFDSIAEAASARRAASVAHGFHENHGAKA